MWWSGDIDGSEHVDQSRSRDALPRVAARAAGRHAPRGRRAPRRARGDPRRPPRRTGACGSSRPTTRCPGSCAELRDHGLTLAVCSNWDWDLEPAIAETGLDGWFDTLVSSAWAGARKPHPRIYRYLLDQSRPRSRRDPLRRRHLGSRRGGTARGRDDAGLPRARRALARRDAPATTPQTSRSCGYAICRGLLPLLGAAIGRGCVRRRGRSGLLRPCGPGRRRTRRADPLPGCGSPMPWMAEKWTNTSGPSSREMKP